MYVAIGIVVVVGVVLAVRLAPERPPVENDVPDIVNDVPDAVNDVPDLEPGQITAINGKLNPDWTRIAFVRRGTTSGPLFVADLDGENEERIAELYSGLYVAPTYHYAWSPGGGKIAYTVSGAVKAVNTDGSGEVILQASGAHSLLPRWFGDESMVYYYDTYVIRLYVADGSQPYKTISFPVGISGFIQSWTPNSASDGMIVVINTGSVVTAVERGLDGEERQTFFELRELLGTTWIAFSRDFVSPDLQKIAFVDNQGLSIVNMNGSILFQSDELQRLSIYWSPDSHRVAYLGREEVWVPGRGEYAAIRSIWVMNADGTGRTKIIESEDIAGIYGWSPDGSVIAYTVRNEDGIFALPVD